MTPAFIDVHYLDQPHLIACGVIETHDGLVLVDPGPTVSLPTLREALGARGASLRDVTAILVTHIHLDHAGGVGTLVRQFPDIRVFVHAIGARHLVAPERLIRSATRIYGDQMDTLWGEFEAVPADSITALEGGEQVSFGSTRLRVAYTPGHAIHHVSFLDERAGCAYVGDTAGMRVHGSPFVLPVTPPPDVHLGHWEASLKQIGEWQPEWLFTTHFGPHQGVETHLTSMLDGLQALASRVKATLEVAGSEEERAEAFEAEVQERIMNEVAATFQPPYQKFSQPMFSWYGMARYLRKQERQQ